MLILLWGAHAAHPYCHIQGESAKKSPKHIRKINEKKNSEQCSVTQDWIKTTDQFENDFFHLGYPPFPKTKQNKTTKNWRKGYFEYI